MSLHTCMPADDKLMHFLKLRLQQPLPGVDAQMKLAPDIRQLIKDESDKVNIQSSVLILLFPDHGIWHIVFIKRSEYNGVHSGQVGFPGGKMMNGETELQTALRETAEEIGINPLKIKILGKITPLFIPVSKTKVNPFVGYLVQRPVFTPCKKEVDYVIELPVLNLLQPDAVVVENLHIRGYSIKAAGYKAGNDFIWGATAMMLGEFVELLSDACKME